MSLGSTLFWSAVALGCVALAAPGLDEALPSMKAPASVAALPASRSSPAVPGLALHEMRRGANGHFYAEAQVNGARVGFLIDTGASLVALTPQDAQRAGVVVGPERATARGAGGPVQVAPVVIDRLVLGPVAAQQVRGAVVENLPMSLLGQSFLAEAAAVEIRGDVMTIR